MMVDGAEEGQFRGPIDFLAPYTSTRHTCRRRSRRRNYAAARSASALPSETGESKQGASSVPREVR